MKLLSPVFGKEMITLARGKRHYFARAALLGLLLFVMGGGWSSGMRYVQYSGYADFSHLGNSLFQSFAWTQLAAVVFLMPALTAPVVATEKDRDTLNLLLMSNLKRHNILLDKLLSRMALVSLLLLSGLPLFLALLAFGGITPGMILVAYLWIFSAMLICSGAGLIFSTLMNKMYSALIAAYIAIATYIFAALILEENFDSISSGSLLPSDFAGSESSQAGIFTAVSFAVFLICLLTSILLLPRCAGTRKRHWLKSLFSRMNTFFNRINFTGVVVMDENRALKKNAFLWKEAHKSFFGSNTFIIRASYTMVALSLVALTLVQDFEVATGIVTFFCMIIMAMISVVASATAFTSEHDRNSFEIIMASPLTAKSIVLAKFIGVMKKTIPVLTCMLIWTAISELVLGNSYARWYESTRSGLAGVILLAAAQVPMIVVIGLHAGLRRRKAALALLQTFLICALWTVVPMLGLYLADYHDYYHHAVTNSLKRIVEASPAGLIISYAFNEHLANKYWSTALIPLWLWYLAWLTRRFDRMVGRQ